MAELNCGTEKACGDCMVSTLPKGEVTDEVVCALSAIAGTHFRSGTDTMFSKATNIDEGRLRANFILSKLIDDDDYVTGEQKQALDFAVPHIMSGECITE